MQSATIPQARAEMFYGWWVVAGAFAVMFMGFGAAYCFGSFFQSLHDEFGATRREVSLVFSLTALLYFFLGAVSGPLADRIGPKRVIGVGGLFVGLGLLLAATTQQLWQATASASVWESVFPMCPRSVQFSGGSFANEVLLLGSLSPGLVLARY